jgi:acetyl-CoA C-acetyltransferase/acetyl-CoA acyltransferase
LIFVPSEIVRREEPPAPPPAPEPPPPVEPPEPPREEEPAPAIEIRIPAPRATVVLAAGLRLPQAKAGGAYRSEDAGHLGAAVTRELLARAGVDAAEIDELIAGCVGPPHDQANVGRVISLRAGLPQSTPARTVSRNCASGIEAVTSACTMIEAGRGDTFLCVGVEVMSQYPLLYGHEMTDLFGAIMRAKSLTQRAAAIARFRPSFLKPRIALMEGLTDPTCGLIMGRTAELLAREFDVTRREADEYACESHRRATAARDSGRLAREMAPHLPLRAKPDSPAVQHDDGIRDGQTVEGLAKLPPYFEKPDGVVTVGNSCGITDGTSALLVTTPERANELGLAPLAAIKSWAVVGLDPSRMGLGPVFASALALERAGCELSDMGVIELNEAFATQVLACQRAAASATFAREKLGRSEPLGTIDSARLNKNGGAIALGHPVGATGTRLLLTAAHELAVSDSELALATLCIGGGQGSAVVLERIRS